MGNPIRGLVSRKAGRRQPPIGLVARPPSPATRVSRCSPTGDALSADSAHAAGVVAADGRADMIDSSVRRNADSCKRRAAPPERNGMRATPERSGHDFDVAGTAVPRCDRTHAATEPCRSPYSPEPNGRSRPAWRRNCQVSVKDRIAPPGPPPARHELPSRRTHHRGPRSSARPREPQRRLAQAE